MKRRFTISMLAFGGFLVGTAEMMVAGILDMVADDLHVSVGLAGQSVTMYALVFAVGTPVLIAAASRLERKTLLLSAFAIFIAGNVLACLSASFWWFMFSRAVLAASAGIIVVVSLTVGSRLASPDQRGSAIGTVIMGFSLSLVLGVPLGALIGDEYGWKMNFALLAALAFLLWIALWKLIPSIGADESVPLKKQLSALRNRKTVSALFVTFFWIMGYQLVFTFVSPFLRTSAGIDTAMVSTALLVCGLFSVAGSRFGGFGADRWGSVRTILFSLAVHAGALLALPFTSASVVGALVTLAVWFGAAWTTTPAQQYYLVSISPKNTDFVLSLNNAVLQLGIAVGAAVGGVVVQLSSVRQLGWVGAVVEGLGFLAAVYSFSRKNPAGRP
jgi:DHA1 family putative efflux transporter-like MFS transporter